MDAKDAAILRRARCLAFRSYFYEEGRAAAEAWLGNARAYSRKKPELARAVGAITADYSDRKARRNCDQNRLITWYLRDKVRGRRLTIRTSWRNLCQLLKGTGTLAEKLYFLEEADLCRALCT